MALCLSILLQDVVHMTAFVTFWSHFVDFSGIQSPPLLLPVPRTKDVGLSILLRTVYCVQLSHPVSHIPVRSCACPSHTDMCHALRFSLLLFTLACRLAVSFLLTDLACRNLHACLHGLRCTLCCLYFHIGLSGVLKEGCTKCKRPPFHPFDDA